jgi:biopolymer transport protein ExbD
MAAKLGGSDEGEALSDINVTPLVDVVLVLLIVFMITVPSVVGSAPVKVDLPGTSAILSAMQEPQSLPIKVNVKREEGQTRVYLGEQVVSLDEFAPFLRSLGALDKESPVQIAADRSLPYRDVVKVMDCLSSVGVSKLSLETKQLAP